MTLVVHSIASLAPSSGGPSRTVTALTDGLVKNGFSIALLTQSQPGESQVESESGSTVDRRVAFSRFKPVLRSGMPFRKLLKRFLDNHKPSLIHHHGIWDPVSHFSVKLAQEFDIPLMLHTRGMLEPWALDYRAPKKRLAMSLYQRKDLEAAKIIFATAHSEVQSLRSFGLKQPIAVIPNGVTLPIVTHTAIKNEQADNAATPRKALFMSRIHPVKGILNLIDAWANVRPDNWQLSIAGPDEGDHLSVVKRRVQDLGIEQLVDFPGEVGGDVKAALLRNADLFILPSFSENFGVVVAEALAYGVPVITTRGTPWQGLLSKDCGWWIEPDVDALTETLQEATSTDPARLSAMGERGRLYAGEFNWSHIASQTAAVYRWVLGQESMPSCVVTVQGNTC